MKTKIGSFLLSLFAGVLFAFAPDSLAASPQSFIRFLSPADGDYLQIGEEYELRWESSPNITRVYSAYSWHPNSFTWIMNDIPNTGSFRWRPSFASGFLMYIMILGYAPDTGEIVSDARSVSLGPELPVFEPLEAEMVLRPTAANRVSAFSLTPDNIPDWNWRLRLTLQVPKRLWNIRITRNGAWWETWQSQYSETPILGYQAVNNRGIPTSSQAHLPSGTVWLELYGQKAFAHENPTNWPGGFAYITWADGTATTVRIAPGVRVDAPQISISAKPETLVV